MMLFCEKEIAGLEALLLVANDGLTVEKLAEILQINSQDVLEILELLKERYKNPSCGFTIVEVNKGYKIGTKPEVSQYIETLYQQPVSSLSGAALEVLAIIAYKQPVTKGEIDFLRGVQSDRALATLVEKELVKEVGRKESPGRPILYGTTEQFLIHFGLTSLEDLPSLNLQKTYDEKQLHDEEFLDDEKQFLDDEESLKEE